VILVERASQGGGAVGRFRVTGQRAENRRKGGAHRLLRRGAVGAKLLTQLGDRVAAELLHESVE